MKQTVSTRYRRVVKGEFYWDEWRCTKYIDQRIIQLFDVKKLLCFKNR
jgi:hypothetical protein